MLKPPLGQEHKITLELRRESALPLGNSPLWATAMPCGLVNSPLPRPLFPTAMIRSSSIRFRLDPSEFHELALIGLELPGVDLLLLTLLLPGLGRDAE